jgi:hypothetical protein
MIVVILPIPAILAKSTPSLASGQFTFLASGFTQDLYGLDSSFLGGLAFAPNGDPWVDNCLPNGGALHRYDHGTTLPSVHGTSTLHPETTVPSGAGCGLTNHPNGALYGNTSSGVVKLDANNGAPLGGPFGPAGNVLGITPDPTNGNLVYVESNGTLGFVTADLTGSGTFSTATSGDFVDGIFFDPTGNFLFASNRSPTHQLTILRRDGTIAQNVSMVAEPDGIAFHSVGTQFVVTNNTDGTMTRFDFPGNNFTTSPTQSLFASGGFRGDLTQVGADGCLYVTQNATRYDDGTVDNSTNSVIHICPGFSPSPGVKGADRPATSACTRTLSGDIPGSLTVGSGTTCLTGARIGGKVSVQPRAALSALNSTIIGPLSSTQGAGLTLCGSTVAGKVTVASSTGFVLIGDGGDGSVSCRGNTIQGSVTLGPGNLAGTELGGNKIQGKVEVKGNTAPTFPSRATEDAATEVEANEIGDVLICSGNAPAPTNDGLANSVAGTSKGQCAGLDGAGPGGALMAAPPRDELVVCGDAAVPGPLPAQQTPCVSAVASPKRPSETTSTASAYNTSGAVTVAGRDAPVRGRLQVQFAPAGSSTPCTAIFLTPPNSNILGTVMADTIGNYAAPGTLPLPSPTAVGTAHVCVVGPPSKPGGKPKFGETVPISIVTGSGPNGDCLQANVTPADHDSSLFSRGGTGAGWTGSPGNGTPIGGVYSKISNYDPYTQPNTGDVSAWTMLLTLVPVQGQAKPLSQLAQTGWLKGDLRFPPGTPPQTFVEYIDEVNDVAIFESGGHLWRAGYCEYQYG